MNQPVLVLNANFEPINVCTTRRAVNLILAEKASLIMNGRGVIKTVNESFPRPSIVRLEKMIHRPRIHIIFNRREIFRRDNHTCQYCGKQTPILTIDHVIPRTKGGTHTWENVVAACPQCNHRKGGKLAEDVGMRLLRAPREPFASAQYIFGHHLSENLEWTDFITGW